MKISLYSLILLMVFLTACSPNDAQLRNPKFADVQVEADLVTIEFPRSTRYFFLEKVEDDSVPFDSVAFRHNLEEDIFYFRTNLDDWQPVPPDETSITLGLVVVEFGEKDTRITYPSGSWAFP